MYEDLKQSLRDVAFTTATPFTDDGTAVDHDALAANLGYLSDAGGRLFIPCGNTGEYYALDDGERAAVVETHAETLPVDATVVGGLGGSIPEATALADAYESAGADALMVMHPDHTYAHDRGLVEYYRAIVDATDLGVVIYKRGPGVPRSVIADLVPREGVVGVKFAVNDIKEFSQSVADCGDDAVWLNGVAERYAPGFAVEGAAGFTTGVGNFLPEVSLELHDAIEAGDWERARDLRELLRPLEDLREETGGGSLAAANNVPLVKRGLELAGLHGGPVRPPLVELSDDDRERVDERYEAVRAAF